MGQIFFKRLKSKSKAFLAILIASMVTFFASSLVYGQITRGNADPDKLISKKYTKIRCEVLFTDFARFIQNRQRVLLTPLKDSELDLKFQNWMDRINKTLKADNLYTVDFDQITNRVLELTTIEKKQLATDISIIYTEVTKEKYRAVKLKELKRTLDLILSRIERPDLNFENATDQTAWSVYKNYFETARRHTGQEIDYDTQKVWNLLHWIKRRLNSEEKGNKELNGAEVVIYGSFINGRAVLKDSDIDALANSAATSRFVDRLNEDSFFKSFGVDHIAANSSAKFSEWSASQLSPLIFVVNAEYVIMKVYPPLSYSTIQAKRSEVRPMTFIFY